MAQGIFNGWQSLTNPRVIHHAAVVERHVEIDAHEHAAIVQGKITNRKLGHGSSSMQVSAVRPCGTRTPQRSDRQGIRLPLHAKKRRSSTIGPYFPGN